MTVSLFPKLAKLAEGKILAFSNIQVQQSQKLVCMQYLGRRIQISSVFEIDVLLINY